MSLQGDTELRDLVAQTLENTGVLAKIRAELRASVFLVLEEHEAFKGRNLSFSNKPLRDFLSTQEGIIVINLIREFLEYFGLEFTASVLEPETEAGKDYEYVGRSKLAQDLKLNSGKKTPLIAQVLQESKICFSNVVPTLREDLTNNCLKKEKTKEDKKTQDVNNHVLKTDVVGVNTNVHMKSVESGGKEVDNKPSPPSFQSQVKKPDTLKLDLNQMNLRSPLTSSLSSLGALPPLNQNGSQNTQPHKIVNSRNTKQVPSDIKALLDFGSDSQENNYEEDFHPSGSEKTSKGTNRSLSGSGSEIEEEMSVGADDQTSDLSGSNGSGSRKHSGALS